ncbi:polysaccharide deacetylase family protein [Niallia sp. XMNu-256]|uniref:polysaccharide deacetylase family protein n=1 Tax=Niallia sp. XMNu-256 TaxID=3082444 RepID=UPI0030D56EDD
MKKKIKKITKCILVKLGDFLPSSKNTNVQHIYYHEVVLEDGFSYDKIRFEKFKQQMHYLIDNHYNTLTFEDLNNLEGKETANSNKNILITFDDGYYNNYHLVYPFMKNVGLKFNVFLEVGAIGKKNEYLTWDMVKEMNESGIVNFGAHTLNHVDARFIDKQRIDNEFLLANEIILTKVGIDVNDFCFPYGMYDNRIVKLLDELNLYKRLYTSDGRKPVKKNNIYLIGRVGIENEDNQEIFIEKINGKHNLYNQVIRNVKSITKGYKNEVFRRN